MSQARAIVGVIGAFLVLGGLVAAAAPGDQGRVDSEGGDKCCFKNSRYAGVCVVQLVEEETCASILGYLNDPSSGGKSYCGFTEIRGGWKEVACQEKTASRRFSVPVQIPDRVGVGSADHTLSDQTHEEAYSECLN